MHSGWLSVDSTIVSACPRHPPMFAAVVHTAAAGWHQQSVSESTAGRRIVAGRVMAAPRVSGG